MQEILRNVALFALTRFCVNEGIDCSGSYVRKAARAYHYELIKQATGGILVSVTFARSNAPVFLRG